MKKRIYTILLSCITAFSLVACQSKTTQPETQTNISSNETKSQEEINAEMAELVENFQKFIQPAFEVGTVVNGEYTNATLGIGCKLDDSWVFKTEEEIAALNSISDEYLDEAAKEQIRKSYESGRSITDMYAQQESTDDVITVSAQDLFTTASLYSVDQYIEANIDPIKSTLEQMGYSNIEVQVIDYTCAGNSGKALQICADISETDMKFYELCFVFKNGNVFTMISAGSITEGRCEELLSLFYAVDSAEE